MGKDEERLEDFCPGYVFGNGIVAVRRRAIAFNRMWSCVHWPRRSPKSRDRSQTGEMSFKIVSIPSAVPRCNDLLRFPHVRHIVDAARSLL
jgi:hypothetical protein